MNRRLLVTSSLVFAALLTAVPASASPVATSDSQYTGLGAVFPDPQGGPCAPACSPTRRGNVRAQSFIQWAEFVDAVRYMNTSGGHPEWARFMEILPLDGKLDDASGGTQTAGTQPGTTMAPGNNLPFLEWDPKPEYISAGLATTEGNLNNARRKSDLIVIRVTDENVPDEGKKRYALSLSIHGIERAGAEGGIRAMEDLVTAHTAGSGSAGGPSLRADEPIVPPAVKAGAPTYREVLAKTIIYFTFPNPDGWRRGSMTSEDLGPFFQRYNGNGVDLNRDWPGMGFSYRGYSALSEPETWAFANFFLDVKRKAGPFALGDDLHGQPGADALSYTLLPQGRRDYGKDLRIRRAAERINRATFEAIKWNPLVQDNDRPPGECSPAPVYSYCDKIYAQTWGTVYDTINYTTSGTLGDWFDQAVGLGAEGIDNEMSYSHLDKNIIFDNNDVSATEQLHVDGNKALIYARITELLDPPTGVFDAPGRKGYVPTTRVRRDAVNAQGDVPPNTRPQDKLNGTALPEAPYEFDVRRTEPEGGQPGIYNGGMRVTARTTNINGVGTGTATLTVQCRACDEHPGVPENNLEENDGWITVAQDYNQSLVYAQAGLVVTVNRPDTSNRNGKPVEWRAVVNETAGKANVEVEFFSRPASGSGDFADPSSVEPAGGQAPVLNGYDVANTDFFRDLNAFIPRERERFGAVDPRKVIAGSQSLDRLASLVLADDPLPGYTGPYGEVAAVGPPTKDIDIAKNPAQDVGPGAYGFEHEIRKPGTFTRIDFSIAPTESNRSLRVRIDWEQAVDDWDMFLYRVVDGEENEVGRSTGTHLETNFEEINVGSPDPGDYRLYVDNFAARPSSSWSGKITFQPLPPVNEQLATGAFTIAEKNAWFAALRSYVRDGGNLVLTDGALRALPELTDGAVRPNDVKRVSVYAGQVTFGRSDGESTKEDPLATTPINIQQQGSRDNGGRRRQTFEPTPLGFFVDPDRGQVGAHQWDVARKAFEAAGGRVVGTSATAAVSAEPVYDRVTLGEIPQGTGRIRVIGALLPQPQTTLDHEYGVEPYAVTYTGYILARNLLEVPDRPDPPVPATGGPSSGTASGSDTVPGSGSSCASVRSFAFAGARPVAARRKRTVRFAFARLANRPVTVEVFQSSRGTRILGERKVARFTGRRSSFDWNGRSNTGARVRDGYFFVRYRMSLPGRARPETRRVVLRRSAGRWTVRPSFYRRESCGLLRAYKLALPVFGGFSNRALGVAFQLADEATVRVRVLRGRRVVRTYRPLPHEGGRFHRLLFDSEKLPRGNYRFELRATRGGKTVRAVLTARRL